MSVFSHVLIDSCVFMDAYLAFREGHQQAQKLLRHFAGAGAVCSIPSHAYFEQAVAAIVHFKHEPNLLFQNQIKQSAIPNLVLQVVALDNVYALKLLQSLRGTPIPDLKSQDLIYFCVARDKDLTLITEDRRLRNVAREGGLRAFHVDEVIELLHLNV